MFDWKYESLYVNGYGHPFKPSDIVDASELILESVLSFLLLMLSSEGSGRLSSAKTSSVQSSNLKLMNNNNNFDSVIAIVFFKQFPLVIILKFYSLIGLILKHRHTCSRSHISDVNVLSRFTNILTLYRRCGFAVSGLSTEAIVKRKHTKL